MNRPTIRQGVDDRLLTSFFVFVLVMLSIGCVDRGGVVVPEPDAPVVKAQTSEREFLFALARAVDRGDFDDTDQFQIAMRRSAKNLGLDADVLAKPLNETLGDLSETKPLTNDTQRKSFAAKLQRAAEVLK